MFLLCHVHTRVVYLKKLTKFAHTGALEVFNNVFLKYAPKRIHFSYKTMLARLRLAVLDQNSNIKQELTQTKTNRDGSKRYKEWSKRKKEWTIKEMHSNKSTDFIHDLAHGVVKRRENDTASFLHRRTALPIPAVVLMNLAQKPKPSKQETVRQHQSRFTLNELL